MNKVFLLFIIAICLQSKVFALKIEGQNKSYANKQLDFYKYTDPVTLEKESVFSITFDNDGKFCTNAEIGEVSFLLCDFGVYRGMLFLEPEQSVKLQLPPFKEKSFADQKNPFFKPVQFWIRTEEKENLNTLISAFDLRYNHLTDKYFNALFFRKSRTIYQDSVVAVLSGEFSQDLPEAFKVHKALKIKSLEMDVFRVKTENVTSVFSGVDNKCWVHPAFIELFGKTFTNRLSVEAKEIKGTELRKAVAATNIQFIQDLLKSKYKLSGNVAELALVKMLHDGYYSGDFSKLSIQKLLASEKMQNNKSTAIRALTVRVAQKLKHLQKGTSAPVLCLKDIDGVKKCTNETTGKFKYFVFADSEMVVCREHLKYLATIEAKFQKHLEIVVILRKTDLIKMKMFLVKNNIAGLKLLDLEGTAIARYNVKSFPQCFLLNEKHEVEFATANAPLDGFEQQFGNFLQKELFNRLRNQSR